MSRPYRLSAEARRQIDLIGAFVADDNVDAALKIDDAFEDAFSSWPNPASATREDLTTRPVKFWSVFTPCVVYDQRAVPIAVTAVPAEAGLQPRLRGLVSSMISIHSFSVRSSRSGLPSFGRSSST